MLEISDEVLYFGESFIRTAAGEGVDKSEGEIKHPGAVSLVEMLPPDCLSPRGEKDRFSTDSSPWLICGAIGPFHRSMIQVSWAAKLETGASDGGSPASNQCSLVFRKTRE